MGDAARFQACLGGRLQQPLHVVIHREWWNSRGNVTRGAGREMRLRTDSVLDALL
jgi:hypothetical protein